MSDPLPPYARVTARGLELRLKVVPGARRTEPAGVLGDRLKIRVAAPPEDGKANRAVLALLTERLGTRDVALVAGHGRPEKLVRLGGLDGLTPAQRAALADAGAAEE